MGFSGIPPAPTPPYAPPTDRLALELSTSTQGNINWTGATTLESVGSSISVVTGAGGYIVNNVAGLYAATALLEMGYTAGGEAIAEIFWTPSQGPWNTSAMRNGIAINSTTDTSLNGSLQIPLAMAYFFPSGTHHTFNIQWGANTTTPVTFQIAFQRIS